MKKMNNQGFLLTEILVVSVFITTVLIYFFVQIRTINRNYSISFLYNNVNRLYAGEAVRDYYASTVSGTTGLTVPETVRDEDESFVSNYLVLIADSDTCSESIEGPVLCSLLTENQIEIIFLIQGMYKKTATRMESNAEIIDLLGYTNILDMDYYYIIAFTDGTYAAIKL